MNTTLSLFLLLSHSNLFARTLRRNKFVTKKVVIEISRTNYDEEQANKLAMQNILSKPDDYLGTGDGVKYKDCKVKKKKSSIYKKTEIVTDGYLNDKWNISMEVTCTSFINSSGRNIVKEVDSKAQSENKSEVKSK